MYRKRNDRRGSLNGYGSALLPQHGAFMRSKIWTIWKYTIGSFSDEKTADYDDYVAIVRTLIVLVNFVTCFFIMANTIHNW